MYNMDILGIKNVVFRRKYGDFFENMDEFFKYPCNSRAFYEYL